MPTNLTESLENSKQLFEWDALQAPKTPKSPSMRTLSPSSTQPLKTISLDQGQQAAVDIMHAGRSVFLTGMAGTGKSSTLCEFLIKSHETIHVTATTGIAALTLQEQYRDKSSLGLPAFTIYRWAGIGLGPKNGQSFDDFIEYMESAGKRSIAIARKRIAGANTLVIDEISMLPGRMVNFLDHYFRHIRVDKKDLPFGGIQMIFVGDFLQLPPVSKTGKYDWAFQSAAWKALNPLPIYLKTIHRQDEPDFIAALNSFREGKVSQKVADTLAARVSMFTDRNIPRLFTHNAQVDRWNTIQIEALEGEAAIFKATYTGSPFDKEWFIRNSITPEILTLKVGARVMVTANIANPDGGMLAVNGQMGTVISLSTPSMVKEWDEAEERYRDVLQNLPMVRLDNKEELAIARRTWTMDPQKDSSPSMTQTPLRPAYAISIHKSQGLTLPCAVIDIRAAREPGQAYVALSRLKSLKGLHLKEWIKGVHVSPDAINYYRNL